jgi:hypothetical protein
MRRLLLLPAFSLLITSCVKETDWPPDGEVPKDIIVDALVTDEVKTHRVMLSYPVGELDQPPEPVTGAAVLISNEDSTWQLTEYPSGSGVYCTPSTFHALLQKNYTLLISAGGKIYTAKATMTGGAFFRELTYARDESSGMYYVDWVASAFSLEGPAMWELLLDWSHVPGYESLDSLDNHARMLFYTLPTLDVSEVFAPMMEALYFPAGTIITERRYSLTAGHAEFIRGMLLETSWTGGLFPVAPANVGSNLSEGAYGYFGACAVTELSVTVLP